jgi:hypothetical protein
MTARVWPVDAVAGAPVYSGRALRQSLVAPLAGGASSTRPLGARSGVRPGTPASTVTATSTTWTCRPHAGVLDVETAAEAGPYGYAIDANVTGSVNAANATNPRIDIIYVQLSDPAESDGSSVPGVLVDYLAGTAASSPSAPAAPARAVAIAQINVPAAGGGSPSVTWVAPYAVAAGGVIPVRSTAELTALNTIATPENPLVANLAGDLYTSVGAGFGRVGSPELTATFALNALWTPHSRGISLTRRGGRWLLDVAIVNANAGTFNAGWAPLGTIPAAARTSGGTMNGAAGTLSNYNGLTATVINADLSSGAVQWKIPSTGTIGAGELELHAQITWDA